MIRAIAPLLGLACVGCFSTADFSTCTAAGQCGLDAQGRGLVCRAGECVRPGDDETGERIEGRVEQLTRRVDQTVRLGDITLGSPVMRVEAEVIVVEGYVDGRGAGEQGGDGGGFGVIGALGLDGEPGRPRGDGGGDGGAGGRACQSDGAPGLDGVLTLACGPERSFDLNVAGRGGGGGGGGAGTALCRGTKGGPGGDGGGAILLRATRYIEVRGALDVRGLGGNAPQSYECTPDDPEAAPCMDGGDPFELGDGGPGGGGSGGHVYLEAPTVVFSRGAALDVSGGGGGGVGAVTVVGAIEGRFEGPVGRGATICTLP